MELNCYETQREEIKNAINQQLQEGKVVVLIGEWSESNRLFNSELERFETMKLEDGSTAFYLKREFLAPTHYS